MSEVLGTALSVIAANPFLQRLTGVSVDLVVVAAVVAAFAALGRGRSPRVVALLWLVVLVKPIVGLALGTPAPLPSLPSIEPAVVTPAVGVREVLVQKERSADGGIVEEETLAYEVLAVAGARDWGRSANIIVFGWLAGVVFMLGRSIVQRLRLRRVLAESRPAGERMLDIYRDVAAAFRRGRKPRVVVTDSLESPAIAGTFRPIILIPAWMAREGHADRLEWSLRHELAHWSSRDPLANFAAEAARVLFYYHPAIWWAARRWKEAMEVACDATVVSSRRDAKRYAQQLYATLAHVNGKRLALSGSLFATRTQIGRRIEILLRSNSRVARPGVAATAFVIAFAAASFALGADFAPAPPTPPVPPIPEAPPAPAAAPAPEATVDRAERHSYRRLNIHETSDDREVRIEAKGRVSFSGGDVLRIDELSDDGFVIVEEKTKDWDRRVKVTRGDDGDLTYEYRVDGRRAEWNDDARRWFSDVVRAHLDIAPPAELIRMLPAPKPPTATAAVESPAPVPAPQAPPRDRDD